MSYAASAPDTLDDLTLIQRFVQGKTSLECNRNLRVESALNTIRLSTKIGVFLAKFRAMEGSRLALIRQDSPYWELISQILIEHGYMPTGVTEEGLMRYELCVIPQGYEMRYTEARLLWRAWRSESNSFSKLLLHTSQGWQRVSAIETSQQLLFIKTAADELMIHNGDRVVWLSPVDAEESKTQIFAYQPFPKPCAQVSNALSALSKVIEMRDGRLYIQTDQGELVVEGTDLKFYLQDEQMELEPESIMI